MNSSRFGMGLVIHRHQLVQFHRVMALGRAHPGSPEQPLDAPQVTPRLEQMRGKAVPKPVRSDGLAHAALLQILLQKPLDTPGGQPVPSAIEKERAPGATDRKSTRL